MRGHQSSTKFRHRGTLVVGTTPRKQQLHLEHLVRGHQSGTVWHRGTICGGHHSGKAATAPRTIGEKSCTILAQFQHRGTIVVGTTPGKQQLHLEHLMRGHQSGTVSAPGGRHHSGKAVSAPAGSDCQPCLFSSRSRRLNSYLYSWGI